MEVLSHLLYGEDKAAVRPLNLQKRAAAAVFLRWPQGGPTPFGYILQAVGSPWNYNCVVKHFFISTLTVAIRQAETKELVKTKKNKKKIRTRYRLSGRTFAFGPPCGRLAVALRSPFNFTAKPFFF